MPANRVRIIQHPEINVDGFRAVAYGTQDVVVYDTLVDDRQAVWNDLELEDARRFVDALRPYLAAYKANQGELTEESAAALNLAFNTLPSAYQAQALKIAVARFAE